MFPSLHVFVGQAFETDRSFHVLFRLHFGLLRSVVPPPTLYAIENGLLYQIPYPVDIHAFWLEIAGFFQAADDGVGFPFDVPLLVRFRVDTRDCFVSVFLLLLGTDGFDLLANVFILGIGHKLHVNIQVVAQRCKRDHYATSFLLQSADWPGIDVRDEGACRVGRQSGRLAQLQGFLQKAQRPLLPAMDDLVVENHAAIPGHRAAIHAGPIRRQRHLPGQRTPWAHPLVYPL